MIFINGKWQPGRGEILTSINPADKKLIWQGEAANEVDVSLAIAAARKAFFAWSITPLAARIELMKKMQAKIKENSAALAQCISQETGKALWECEMEAQSMVTKIDISLEAYAQRTGEVKKNIDTFLLHVRHRPLGVLAIFVPFNFPGHLLNTHVVPALLAGNTVVIKPSELTPKTAQL
ncbi:MAG TPA: aldehyde dehydrogenase family protein, partial [Gammaproteobacteria bacterium]|nr:aldehyde dehydrogenase family protein [Gammaproteobacteria bacterium]